LQLHEKYFGQKSAKENALAVFTSDYRTTSGQQYSPTCRGRTPAVFSVCCDVLGGPFLFGHRLV
jgi:hypothetical protein